MPPDPPNSRKPIAQLTKREEFAKSLMASLLLKDVPIVMAAKRAVDGADELLEALDKV